MSIADNRKRKGRPTTGIGKPLGLRLYPDLEAALDAWIARQPEPKPSRPEAVRRLLAAALAVDKPGEQVGRSLSKVEAALEQESELATVSESERLRTKPPKSG